MQSDKTIGGEEHFYNYDVYIVSGMNDTSQAAVSQTSGSTSAILSGETREGGLSSMSSNRKRLRSAAASSVVLGLAAIAVMTGLPRDGVQVGKPAGNALARSAQNHYGSLASIERAERAGVGAQRAAARATKAVRTDDETSTQAKRTGREAAAARLGAELLWRDSLRWGEAEGIFQTDTSTPLLLHHSGDRQKGFIYMRNNEIIHQFADKAEFRSETLHTFELAVPAQLWRNGSALLLGTQLPDKDHPVGQWYELQLPDAPGGSAELSVIERAFYGPNQVLTVVRTESPRLIVMTVQNGSGFSELLYEPGKKQFVTINTTFAPENEQEAGLAYRLRKPDRKTGVQSFRRQQNFDFPGAGTLSAFEDDRGTIVYYSRGGLPLVWRYVDHRAVDFKLLTNDEGQSSPLGKFTAPDGSHVLSFPNWGYHSYFRFNPLLFEDGWQMLDMQSFYRISEWQIEVMQYEYDWSTRIAFDQYWTYPANGARLATKAGGMLKFEANGRTASLSAYDLVHYRPQTSAGLHRLEDLWLGDIEAPLTPIAVGQEGPMRMGKEGPEEGPGEGPANAPQDGPPLGDENDPASDTSAETFVSQPQVRIPRSIMPQVNNADLPDEMREAMYKDCIIGCGDFWSSPTVRSIDGRWFLLRQDTLFRLEREALVELGKLPIEQAYSFYYGKGGGTYTAQDYAKIGSHWFVADTFGNRVLKLDEQFRIVSEHPLPLPASIRVQGANKLEVASLKGTTVLDEQLLKLGESAPQPESVNLSETEELQGNDIPHYVDPATGFQWSYFEGYVVRYDPLTERYLPLFAGYNANGAFRTKIVPHEQNILIVMDEKTLVFGRNGAWKRTFAYPRVPPDGEVSHLFSGEGSYQLDAANNKLYLVQGYRILAIDLTANEANSADELFRQNRSTPGPIALYRGKLYFTLHTGDAYDLSKQQNQLVALDLASGALSRYKLEHGYVTVQVLDRDQPELLLRAAALERSADGRRYMVYDGIRYAYLSLPLRGLSDSAGQTDK